MENANHNPSYYAELFEIRFLSEKFKTSSDNKLRVRYEVTMPEIDYWINSLGPDLLNSFPDNGKIFKNKLFYHLKKLQWRPTKIKGRWSKTVYL